AKVFLHRDNELIRLIVADDNRNIQLVNTSNIYKKISYDWQNTPENFAKLDNDFQTMKDSEYTATQGGFSLSNTQSEKENTMNTQQQNTQPDYIWDNAGIPNALYTDSIFAFNNGYTVVISDDLEREVRQYDGFVDTLGGAIVWHKDRETAVAEYNYAVESADENSSAIYLIDNEENTDWDNPHHFEVDILNNPNWQQDLAKEMVSFAVSKEVETGLNADKQFSGSPEIVSVTRDNYAAANRYEQNAAKNPVFLEKIDNRHQPVMPFDDFVAAIMKDTGDSREEVVELASEAFRSQYQAASGYLRGVSDGSVMYNAFDIEMDDKTYYATAPLEWVKEQARVGLSDRGWDLENARHNFLHSSLENNQWETAFHQLKAAADDYKQWRNQVCAFFNFRQPEITLQQGEWTQIAQFLGYKQELEALDNARLMIAEFTPQQAFEFLGVYQQYQRYVSLAEHNAEQGVDNTAIDKQIAALEQSLNEKVAQNLSPTENRQVMFDLFGTQLGLFDEETQEQGVASENRQPESQNTDSVRTLPNNAADWVLYYQATGKMPDFSLYGNSKDYEKLFLLNSAAMSIGVSQKNFEKFLRAVSNNTFVDKIGGGLRLASSRFGSRAYPNWEASELLKTYGLTPVQWSYLWDKGVFDDFEKIDILDITEYRKERPFGLAKPQPETEKQGTTTPENSDKLPENAWKAVPKEKIKEERKDEYFTTPKVLERSNYWIVDNGVVVTLDQYRPMYNRHMTIKTFDTVEEAKKYAERFFELEQGTTTPETSANEVKQDLSGQPEKPTSSVLTKEQKAELKAAKDALTAAKKELKTLRDELDNTRNDQVPYYLQWKEDKANEIIRKQLEVVELQNKFDNLSLQTKTQTGEITELEREILTARLSGSLENRLNIVVRELKAQADYFKQQYNEMGERINKGE
ncbi:MAG: hypothetical protein IKG79_05740, partial [Neisseriaceae bacterium]|nr:hypothetical protein [Neisseriaceae bacterium]